MYIRHAFKYILLTTKTPLENATLQYLKSKLFRDYSIAFSLNNVSQVSCDWIGAKRKSMQLFSQNLRLITLRSMWKVLSVFMRVIENTAELLTVERFIDNLTKSLPVARLLFLLNLSFNS